MWGSAFVRNTVEFDLTGLLSPVVVSWVFAAAIDHDKRVVEYADVDVLPVLRSLISVLGLSTASFAIANQQAVNCPKQLGGLRRKSSPVPLQVGQEFPSASLPVALQTGHGDDLTVFL